MVEDIINKIAEEKKVDVNIVRRIVTSQFLFAKEQMINKKSFKLPEIGSFEFNFKQEAKLASLLSKDKE